MVNSVLLALTLRFQLPNVSTIMGTLCFASIGVYYEVAVVCIDELARFEPGGCWEFRSEFSQGCLEVYYK